MNTEMNDADRTATKGDLWELGQELREELGGRIEKVEGHLHRLSVEYARHEGRLADIDLKLAELLPLKTQFGVFQSTLDHVVGMLEDSRLHSALTESRLSKLEIAWNKKFGGYD